MAWLLLLEKLLMHNGSCLKDKEKLMLAYMNMKEKSWREFYGPGLIPDLISHWVNPFTTKISLLILLAVFHTTDPQIDIFLYSHHSSAWYCISYSKEKLCPAPLAVFQALSNFLLHKNLTHLLPTWPWCPYRWAN